MYHIWSWAKICIQITQAKIGFTPCRVNTPGRVLTSREKKGQINSTPCRHSGVRLQEVVTIARTGNVAGHVVRSCMVVEPGDDVQRPSAHHAHPGSRPTATARHHQTTNMDADCMQGPWIGSPSSPQSDAKSARGGHQFDGAHCHGLRGAALRHDTPEVSRSEALLVAFIISAGLPHAQATELLKIVSCPSFRPDDVRWASWQQWADYVQHKCMHLPRRMQSPRRCHANKCITARAQKLAAFGATS